MTVARLKVKELPLKPQCAEFRPADSPALDIDAARDSLANGSVIAAKLTADEATEEHARIQKLRRFLDGLENQLFDLERIAKLPDDLRLKLYSVASTNLARSIAFMQGLASSFSDAMSVLNQVEQIERARRDAKAVAPDPELERIKDLILAKIRTKSEAKIASAE